MSEQLDLFIDEGRKQCSHCGEAKPHFAFYRSSNRPDGLDSWCKGCRRADNRQRHYAGWSWRKFVNFVKNGYLAAYRFRECTECGTIIPEAHTYGRYARCRKCHLRLRRRREHWADKSFEAWLAHKEKKRLAALGVKQCGECGYPSPIEDFWVAPDGESVDSRCSFCRRKYYREHYQENREEILAQQAKRYRNDPEYRRRKMEYSRRHYRENPELYRANRRWYYHNVRKGDPEVQRQKLARVHQRRARLEGAEGTHDFQDVVKQWHQQRGRCLYCGASCGESPLDSSAYHVDHITPISRGGVNYPRNLCISCPLCNLSKADKWLIEFKLYRRQIGKPIKM